MVDPTPLRTSSTDMEKFILSEMRTSMGDLRKAVDGYRDEAVKTTAVLNEHVKTCDRRYDSIAKATAAAPTTTFPISPAEARMALLKRKVLEKAIDWGLIILVGIIYYAIHNGYKIPIPQ